MERNREKMKKVGRRCGDKMKKGTYVYLQVHVLVGEWVGMCVPVHIIGEWEKRRQQQQRGTNVIVRDIREQKDTSE